MATVSDHAKSCADQMRHGEGGCHSGDDLTFTSDENFANSLSSLGIPSTVIVYRNEVKIKVYRRTGQEGLKVEWRYSSTFSLTSALDVRGWPTQRPSRFNPRYPFYRRLGGPQGRSGRMRKFSPPTGIRSLVRPARCESLHRLTYPGPYLTLSRPN
jgi:hypothetical protein